ncbi:hypothetical protein B0I35DRAFT_417041 [Stachybotrys elegans]|uniref:CSC1/OSCA1-like 7TM region domain-containing protein n=1 Tax=Stachybotrys elegans TaxID=80388 RepID=A0A8K0T3Q1_9HYPO|nr:hypothetical protein B0I35DRAFT_417041 [Stachybotrys elegans]
MSSTTSEGTASLSETLSSISETATSIASTAASSLSEALTSSTTARPPPSQTGGEGPGAAQDDEGIGIIGFLSALGVAAIVFAVQIILFLLLRNKLARIFKPKTYLVPERERTEPPPVNVFSLLKVVLNYSDREIIKKCGLDAYFFLRYLKTLLIIFIPIGAVVMPILIPINYIDGLGQNIDTNLDNDDSNRGAPRGLDTLAWGNVRPENSSRYGAHLLMAILVVIWVCAVFFFELRVYVKVRQDYLTSAEHRLKASATTVLVNSIPTKWLSEEALLGLFDVFPGGVRNVWLNRDLTKLLDKISLRDSIHAKLEAAETELIKAAKKKHQKRTKAEEKKQRRQRHEKALTKEEKAARDAEEDARAKEMAAANTGEHAGDHAVPHNVREGVRESVIEDAEYHKGHSRQESGGFRIPLISGGLSKVGHGLKDVVSKAGAEVDGTLETTNGFMGLEQPSKRPETMEDRRARIAEETEEIHADDKPPLSANSLGRTASLVSADSTKLMKPSAPPSRHNANGVRKLDNIDDMYIKEETKFWQFWKPPSGSYASPVPQGPTVEDIKKAKVAQNRTVWQKVKAFLPFTGGDEEEEAYVYPKAYNEEYKEDQVEAEWQKYLKKKERPTHHLSLFGVSWMPGLPLVTKKVDTIYWCREELARLNVEIEEDQKHPERFPLMNSAFIQFNHQVAAHMACQSVVHHIPQQMSPRMNEISPRDVIWGNMAMPWWQAWLRTALAVAVVLGMTFLWAIPVAWTAALSQIDELVRENPWLSFISESEALENIAQIIAGVLPAVVLGLLLVIIPIILGFLAELGGAKTGAQKSEFVQVFYFVFLFIQVFLIVSIASFLATSLNQLVETVRGLDSPESIVNLLAKNLPKAANYFFSYMILQALSTSSGTLLQVGALFTWYLIARIFDTTARQKWTRNTDLRQIRWGSFFPVYTNFACIALVYCVVAPLISVFAIITFSLLYVAQRYAMLYVIRFDHDTGGVLYPRAINQTFTGIYVMELCMAGLFLIVLDENGNLACSTHGAVMFVVLILTVMYQILLNMAFAPLFRYLPTTFEDEAVLRDQAFQRAQDQRMGLLNDDNEEEYEDPRNSGEKSSYPPMDKNDIELRNVSRRKHGVDQVFRPVKRVGTWAKDGGNQLRKLAMVSHANNVNHAADYRKSRRQKDIEAQRAIGDALFGGFHDEIEDLTPSERDMLTRHAFLHSALRARRPTVWIPRDDLGVSDDEIKRTKEYSENIWISNEGTALDSKLRVVYGRHPPDFSEIDLINL